MVNDFFELLETGQELGELFQVFQHSLEDGKLSKEEIDEMLEKISSIASKIHGLVCKDKK